jgi:hypothetical protein
MNRKKFLLAFLRDNSKVKTGTNSHKGKNMKKIPKNVLKKNCLWQSPRTIPEAKGKNITKTKKHEKHTKKGSKKNKSGNFPERTILEVKGGQIAKTMKI